MSRLRRTPQVGDGGGGVRVRDQHHHRGCLCRRPFIRGPRAHPHDLWAQGKRVAASGSGDGDESSAARIRAQQAVDPVWPPPRPPGPFIDSWAELEPPEDFGYSNKPKSPKRRMSEEQKEKIRNTMKGRVNRQPKTEEHKENIRKAMLRKMNMNSTTRLKISAASKGKPKACRICGTEGHNSRSCPQNPNKKIKAKAKAKGKKGTKAKSERKYRCTLCGELGHNRRSCPSRSSAGAAPSSTSGAGQAPSATFNSPPGRKRLYRCSACGELGHSARTCQVSSAAAASSPPEGSLSPPETNTATVQPRAVPPVAVDSTQPFPATRSDMCKAAVKAADAAYRDGILLQRVDLNLQRTSEGLEMETWPGGIREQFGVALPLVELFLGSLKKVGDFTGRMSAELIDEADAVGCWQNDRMSAVLFPTADTLGRLRELSLARKGGNRLTIVINPQWQPAGQVISDFGFGLARREAEDFVEAFQHVFCHRSLRLLGQNVCLYRCYPGPWQLHLINRKGATADRLCADLTEPGYRRIEELVKRHLDRQKSSSWLDRVRKGNLWSR